MPRFKDAVEMEVKLNQANMIRDNKITIFETMCILISIILIGIFTYRFLGDTLYFITGAQIESLNHFLELSVYLVIFLGGSTVISIWELFKSAKKRNNISSAIITALVTVSILILTLFGIPVSYWLYSKFEVPKQGQKIKYIISELTSEAGIKEAIVKIQILPKKMVDYRDVYALFLAVLEIENRDKKVINYIDKCKFLHLINKPVAQPCDIRELIESGVNKLWMLENQPDHPIYKNEVVKLFVEGYFKKKFTNPDTAKNDFINLLCEVLCKECLPCKESQHPPPTTTIKPPVTLQRSAPLLTGQKLSKEILDNYYQQLQIEKLYTRNPDDIGRIMDQNPGAGKEWPKGKPIVVKVGRFRATGNENEILTSINSKLSSYSFTLEGPIDEKPKPKKAPFSEEPWWDVYYNGTLVAVSNNIALFSFHISVKNSELHAQKEDAITDARQELISFVQKEIKK